MEKAAGMCISRGSKLEGVAVIVELKGVTGTIQKTHHGASIMREEIRNNYGASRDYVLVGHGKGYGFGYWDLEGDDESSGWGAGDGPYGYGYSSSVGLGVGSGFNGEAFSFGYGEEDGKGYGMGFAWSMMAHKET